MATLAVPMTHEEFRALPEPADGATLELIDGEVRIMSGGGPTHAYVIGNLFHFLSQFARAHDLGRVVNNGYFEFVLGGRAWSPVPDVAFVSKSQAPHVRKRLSAFDGSPSLAIEVTSPSNTHTEIVMKVEAYLAAGSIRVWVVDPEPRIVTVYHSDGSARVLHVGDELTSHDAGFEVDGFTLTLHQVFEDA